MNNISFKSHFKKIHSALIKLNIDYKQKYKKESS